MTDIVNNVFGNVQRANYSKYILVSNLLDKLKFKHQKEVIYLRFCFCGCGEHTLKDTANLLGISTERVRQIEIRCLRMLGKKATRPVQL